MRADFFAGGQFMRGGEQSTDDLYSLRIKINAHLLYEELFFIKFD